MVFLPITTKFSRGLPPCLFSSSDLILRGCLFFPEDLPGVGTVVDSSALDPFNGVSGGLDSEAGVTAAFSGLPPLRTAAVATPFSPVLQRDTRRMNKTKHMYKLRMYAGF